MHSSVVMLYADPLMHCWISAVRCMTYVNTYHYLACMPGAACYDC
uniref:Uncharacterized protein n=1 Tax=Arundo donax TaxID=35708 RepID=A0A0A8XPX2_ARUDO